jgi:hypothetical protein
MIAWIGGAGKPDRLGAICARSCLVHLEETGRIGNTFRASFRKRPRWRLPAKLERDGQEQT